MLNKDDEKKLKSSYLKGGPMACKARCSIPSGKFGKSAKGSFRPTCGCKMVQENHFAYI